MKGTTTKELELQELESRVWKFWKHCVGLSENCEGLFSELSHENMGKTEQLLRHSLLSFQFSLSYAIEQFFDELEERITKERK